MTPASFVGCLVAFIVAGCGSPGAPVAPKSAPPAAAKRESRTCREPRSLVVHEPGTVAAIEAGEPEMSFRWRFGEGHALTIGSRTFSLEVGNALSAYEDGKLLWSRSGFSVAGGGFSVLGSPRGGIVARDYSRGSIELFEAASGRPLGAVGSNVVIAPDDTYAIDPPAIPFAQGNYTHDDVRMLTFGPKPKWEHVVDLPPNTKNEYVPFRVAICTTSAIFAVLHSTELGIYRASDRTKLASLPDPGPLDPVFTRSGRYLVLHGGDDGSVRKIVELVAD